MRADINGSGCTRVKATCPGHGIPCKSYNRPARRWYNPLHYLRSISANQLHITFFVSPLFFLHAYSSFVCLHPSCESLEFLRQLNLANNFVCGGWLCI